MAKLQEKIQAILKQPVLAGLATVTEDGKPWVRYIVVTTSDDLTIRTATFLKSRKVKQIQNNPEVHLTCGVNDLTTMASYLQIQARAELKTDQQERHGFWSEHLNAYFKGPDDPNYAILLMKPYRIEYWAPGTLEPEVWCLE